MIDRRDKRMKYTEAVEKRSLTIGKWGNLIMAIAGIFTSFLSHSDALLIDGLYSGVNFFSAIIAAHISITVSQPADRRYPFGYNAHEALYVTFRSLVLLGIIAFALFGAVSKIITYISGGSVPELVFGPIIVYAVVMVIICLFLAGFHYYSWRKSGKESEILKTESKAALIDGILSGGAGGGLFAAGFLHGTGWSFIVPIADAIMVIVLCTIIVSQPLKLLVKSLGEVAGKAADEPTVEMVKHGINELVKNKPFTVLDVVVTKIGRAHFIVGYYKPELPIDGVTVDQLWQEQDDHLHTLLKQVKSEIVIANEPPFPTLLS